MRIAVFGADGALGRAVTLAANARPHGAALGYSRRNCDIADVAQVERAFGDGFDAAINCAGRIPLSQPSAVEYMRVNALGPHVLAAEANRRRKLLIHVSTDCVFSGRAQMGYAYNAQPDPCDLYGRSKAAGEPEHALVVRTSFVTPRHGLWHWLVAQRDGATVDGWLNAKWSGSTVHAVARALVDLAWNPPGRIGVHHLATLSAISKADAIRVIADVLGLDIEVRPVFEPHINRMLINSLPGRHLPPFSEAMEEYRA